MTLGIVLFIIAILVIIMIHEAGHFIVAKIFGFKATQFFLGFGPTVFSFRKGETEYGLKAIPAGGFVKIVGMNPYEEIAPEDAERAYPNKPKWQRALVIVAGSATHWVVAFVILVITTMTIGFPTGEATTSVAVVDGAVNGQKTPAGVAGIEEGDRIVAVGGRPVSSWDEVRDYIRANGGRTARFTIEDTSGRSRTLSVELGRAIVKGFNLVDYAPAGKELRELRPGEKVVGFLGVQPEPEFETSGFGGAIVDSAGRTWELTKLSVQGIGSVFSMVFGGDLWDALTGEGVRGVDEGPLGIVGAGRIAGETVAAGDFLNLIGLIVGFAVFVGLMNLLPLPPLDGGHLAVLVYESVTGRTVDMRKLIPIAAAVISFFVILFIAVLYLDLARPVKLPF